MEGRVEERKDRTGIDRIAAEREIEELGGCRAAVRGIRKGHAVHIATWDGVGVQHFLGLRQGDIPRDDRDHVDIRLGIDSVASEVNRHVTPVEREIGTWGDLLRWQCDRAGERVIVGFAREEGRAVAGSAPASGSSRATAAGSSRNAATRSAAAAAATSRRRES